MDDVSPEEARSSAADMCIFLLPSAFFLMCRAVRTIEDVSK